MTATNTATKYLVMCVFSSDLSFFLVIYDVFLEIFDGPLAYERRDKGSGPAHSMWGL